MPITHYFLGILILFRLVLIFSKCIFEEKEANYKSLLMQFILHLFAVFLIVYPYLRWHSSAPQP